MNKLNFFGIGPKIAIGLIPWLGASIVLSCRDITLFRYTNEKSNIVLYAGIVLMGTGLIFYLSTARMLLKGIKETKLMTGGPYRICQNPLYATICLLIIPALSLLLNSWLIITSSIVGYILFRSFIKSEYTELEKFFGEEYLKYRKSTPEFFPF